MSKLSSRRFFRRQKGQALVFSTITMVVVLLSLFMMVSSGLLTTEKMRLQNTTDAAVYSGALLVSRDYNFSAYTNRAMVANQVAVAQMVGLTAWARHNDDAFNGPLPGFWIAGATSMVGFPPSPKALKYTFSDWPSWGRTAASQKRSALNVTGSGISALDGLLATLSSSQNLLHLATEFALKPTISKVIQANDSDASLSNSVANVGFAVETVNSVMKFTKQYPQSGAQRFAEITHASLDPFSGSDSKDIQRYGPIPNRVTLFDDSFRDWPIPYTGGLRRVWTMHNGGTELSANFKSWTALDVSRMWGYSKWWYLDCFLFICWPASDNFWFTNTLGSGSAVAGSGNVNFGSFTGNNYKRTYSSYGWVAADQMDGVAKEIFVGGNPKIGKFGGLRPYQDLKVLATDPTSRKKITQTELSTVLIEVEKPTPKLLTMGNMQGGPQGNVNLGTAKVPLKLEDRLAGKVMRAVASAEIYFARPEGRSDGKTEWPSLFNPYWQARLKSVSLQNVAFSNTAQ